jgi:uncharacterized protein (TIGR02996 family)
VRTFTFSDARSHKFWNIELKGNSFTVTYGRQGTAGQTQTKTFADDDAAQREHDKLVKEKLGKGYVETTPSAKPAASLRDALEAALVENPDDIAAHMAYADYLQEQGDRRGEFIQVQLALEDPKRPAKERKTLQQRENKLFKEHGRAWLGELAPYLLDQKDMKLPSWMPVEEYGYQFEFRRGWLDRFAVRESFCYACSRVLATAPEARLLRQLVIGGTTDELPDDVEATRLGVAHPEEVVEVDLPEDDDISPALYPLLKATTLGNVRMLQLGEIIGSDENPNCHMRGDTAVALVKRMPKLEELRLLAHRVDTDQLFALRTLDHLRILQVYHGRHYPLGRLAKNPSLGRLTHLLLFPHSADEYEPYIRLADVRAVVRSPTLAALTHLQIRGTDAGDAGCKEIVASGILRRLKVLDLRYGCITDAGAQTLAGCPDLRNLERLDLAGNNMTAAGVKALEATGVKVEAGNQWRSSGNPEDDYQEYLYSGDIE